jgi:HJR/Mrr/RecB family endonuclease
MPEYRVYCLDGANRITRAEQIVATNDDQATEAARALKLPFKCELWHRDRLVARIPASSGQG